MDSKGLKVVFLYTYMQQICIYIYYILDCIVEGHGAA
jgi:hypothetical protein